MPFPSRPIPSEILFVRRDGTTPFTGNVSMGGYRITSSGAPVDPDDLATKDYVDSAGPGGAVLANGTVPLTANWDLDGFIIKGSGAPVDPDDLATKDYVDNAAPGGVLLADGTVPLTADWDIDSNVIKGSGAPVDPDDLVSKTYADGLVTGLVPTTRTLTGTAPIQIAGVNTAVDLSANRTISIVDASGSVAGAVSTGSQTFAGTKTFNGGVVIATGQNVSGAAELNLNAATANNVNIKINNSTVAFFGSDGSLQMGTSVTPALANSIVLKNNAAVIGLTAVTSPGTQTVIFALGTNDQLAIGDSTTLKAVRIQSGMRLRWRDVADAITTILETDGTVACTSITVTRIWTLPAAATVGAGFRVQVKDVSGSVTNAIRISVVPPSGTIEGASSVDISVPYGQLVFVSTGSAWVLG